MKKRLSLKTTAVLSRVLFTVELTTVFLTGSLPPGRLSTYIIGADGTFRRVTFAYTEPRIGALKIRRVHGQHRDPARGARGE